MLLTLAATEDQSAAAENCETGDSAIGLAWQARIAELRELTIIFGLLGPVPLGFWAYVEKD
jgi:hypothetical protein